MSFCVKCGKENEDGNQFCKYCGNGMTEQPYKTSPVNPSEYKISDDGKTLWLKLSGIGSDGEYQYFWIPEISD